MDRNEVNGKVLSALKIALPVQMWSIREGRFVLNTGSAEKFYGREEVVSILNRERATLEVKAGMIRSTLDLLDLFESEEVKTVPRY